MAEWGSSLSGNADSGPIDMPRDVIPVLDDPSTWRSLVRFVAERQIAWADGPFDRFATTIEWDSHDYHLLARWNETTVSRGGLVSLGQPQPFLAYPGGSSNDPHEWDYDFGSILGREVQVSLADGVWTASVQMGSFAAIARFGADGTLFSIERTPAGSTASAVLLGGNDLVNGSTHDDTLVGMRGADELWGREGNDQLCGNQGDDTLVGFSGRDTLTGGLGDDTFFFASRGERDSILDFQRGERIVLDEHAFARLDAHELPPEQFYRGVQAHDENDRIIYDPSTGRVFYDPDGTGDRPQHAFALLVGAPHITAGNFEIVWSL